MYQQKRYPKIELSNNEEKTFLSHFECLFKRRRKKKKTFALFVLIQF